MPEDLLIRPATRSDLTDVLSLYQDLNPEDLNADRVRQEQTYRRCSISRD
ncbi:hypothetical protein [Roseibium sp. MMSF_3412]|nr:hypothetical protein [Roseibium sp. MMSF_3412]